MNAADIKKRSVCIVCFGPYDELQGVGSPGRFFQVTIDPDKASPDGKFLRLGTFDGDEILGWQLANTLSVCSVLAEWDGDTPPKMTWGSLPGVTQGS
jgi:hypothetical protein